MTTSVSRPAATASIASRWPARSRSKPKASRATRSIRSGIGCDSPRRRCEKRAWPYDPPMAHEAELPAWSLDRETALHRLLRSPFPLTDARAWAWEGSTGKGVRVCIVDSGVDGSHPSVGGIQGAVVVDRGADEEIFVEEDDEGDLFGHGTACAAIVRSLAPECEIYSVRTLGRALTGQGAILIAGLEW